MATALNGRPPPSVFSVGSTIWRIFLISKSLPFRERWTGWTGLIVTNNNNLLQIGLGTTNGVSTPGTFYGNGAGLTNIGGYGSLILSTNQTFALQTSVYTNLWAYNASRAGGSVVLGANALTNTVAGDYALDITCSFDGTGGAGDAFECAVFTNNVECSLVEWVRKTSSTDTGSAAATGILPLPANCRVDMRIQNTVGSGNITVRKAALVLQKVN